MKYLLIHITLLSFAWLTLQAQYSPQDCRDAIPVCALQTEFTDIYEGQGNLTDEINKSFSCLEQGEKNSLWLLVNVYSDGELGFVISPNNPETDYDWAVYNISGTDCSEIKSNSSLEVSCNYFDLFDQSNTSEKNNGETGPNGKSNLDRQGSKGTPFNDKIPVLENEAYVIIISSFNYGNTGFEIDFKSSTADIIDNNGPKIESIGETFCGDTAITVIFDELIDCSSVETKDFIIRGAKDYSVKKIECDACDNGRAYADNFRLILSEAIASDGDYTFITEYAISDICGNNSSPELDFYIKGIELSLSASENPVCEGETVTLTVEGIEKEGLVFEWTIGEDVFYTDEPEFYFEISDTSDVHVKVTNDGGCSAESDITVNTIPGPGVNIIQGDTQIDKGNTAQLEVSNIRGTDIVYLWEPSIGLNNTNIANPEASPETSTTYTVTITDTETGCSSNAQVIVTINSPIKPLITAEGSSENRSICDGEALTLDAGDRDPETNTVFVSWKWYKDGIVIPGETNRTLEINEAGTYTVEVSDSDGVTGQDDIIITISPVPDLTLEIPEDAICAGAIFTISAEEINSEGTIVYEWLNSNGFIDPDDKDSSEPEISINTPGDYQYILSSYYSEYNCETFDTVDIEIVEGVDVSITVDTANCEFVMTAEADGGTAPYFYHWEDESALTFPDQNDKSIATVNPLNDVEYTVYIEDGNGCINSATVLLHPLKQSCELQFGSISVDPRDMDVRIPIKFISEENILVCEPRSCYLELSWDITMFNPTAAYVGSIKLNITKNPDLANGIMHVKIIIPGELIPEPGENLVEILGDALLGSSDSAALIIDNVQWGTLNSDNTLNEGTIKLINICNKNGPRYLKYSNFLNIRSVVPNPANDTAEISISAEGGTGSFQLILADLTGRTVYKEKININTGPDENIFSVNLDTGNIKNGLYKLIFTDGINTSSEALMIVK